ncbi:MAG: 2-C-methyl-D-erythritol 4-phosphate cytidylyltransferase, partial [Candidatus Omnitrophica bacterium]|nr:2-C-methyl-D-erythritol 4-phosphate cytidylyltransferase [Candidatus Omnitrophota bacterium]
MYLSAIVLAAGKGERFRSRLPKPVVRLNSRPVIIYSLDILSRHPLIKEIILVVNSLNRGKIAGAVNKYRIPKISRMVEGGARRQDSVYKGLKALDDKTDLVLIHDCGRPFIDKRIVDSVVRAANKYGAAIAGVPLKSTIKKGARIQRHQDT